MISSIYRLVCLSCRAALGFLVTSSPLGLISSTTHGVMTATMTWRGASCLRTSKPGKNAEIRSAKRRAWSRNLAKGRARAAQFNGCLFIWFLQPGCWQLRVGEPKQRHRCLHRRGRQLPPPSSFRGAQPLLTGWLFSDSCWPVALFLICTVSLSGTEAHEAERRPLLDTFSFSILSRRQRTNRLLFSASTWMSTGH